MAVTIDVTSGCELGSGERMIRGSITFDSSYPTGGETVDLSTYLSGSPTVIVNGLGGYVAQHDGGTAAAGKVLLYEAGADAAALDEFGNAADASAIVCPFVAIGLAV
jgi:hypothetical protein